MPWQHELWELIEKIDALCDRRPQGWQLEVKGYLFLFFAILTRHAKKGAERKTPPASLGKIKQIVKYTEDHFSENISLADMADLAGYSKAHFMRFFKANMGRPFTAWLNDYRLSMAARMLRLTSDDILSIAGKSGFGNLSYFNRLFKARYGMTPREYRK